jgi:hypothetical protein
MYFILLGGWVHDVSFSVAGDKLAWVGHDSSISVVAASNQAQIYTIKGEFLPLVTCTWITSNSVVAAGKTVKVSRTVHVQYMYCLLLNIYVQYTQTQ